MINYLVPNNQKLREWVLKSGVSILDQGLIAGSNFALVILLARWLNPAQYGLYAIAFSVYLFLVGIYNALLLEPITVLGSSRHIGHLWRYFSTNFRLHGIVTLIMSILLISASVILWVIGNPISAPLTGLAVALPFILLASLLRRECYILGRPNLALWGSVTYAIFILAGVVVLWQTNHISPAVVFLLLGVASACASLLIRFLQKPFLRKEVSGGQSSEFKRVFQENWIYGKWIIAGTIVFWLTNLVYLPLVGILIGLASAGMMKAIQNFYLPIEHTLTALGLLLLPWLSANRVSRGKRAVLRISGVFSLFSFVFASIYVLVISIAGESLMKLLYGEQYGLEFAPLIVYFGIVALLNAARFGIALGVRAIEEPAALFFSYAAGAIVSLSIGIPLVKTWGLPGAVGGQVLSILISLLVLILLWWRYLRGSRRTDQFSQKSMSLE